MMVKRCDGCGEDLLARDACVITGERTDGWGGRSVPIENGQTFHWCANCARVAFAAVASANRERNA